MSTETDLLAQPDPTKLRSNMGVARVEEDDFVINGVPLTIPPTQIRVEKQSMHYEWNTIRTRNSTTVKSGHGSINISIDVVLKDFSSLVRLVAGLRSTPFCVVNNQYLSGQLSEVQRNTQTTAAYRQLTPIVLAMTSMTFSTMGHEGMVDCIAGHIEFIYFNYFPYTPVFAFKTGIANNVPGPVWQSALWREFVKPYEAESRIPSMGWPMMDQSKNPTILRFKEFKAVPIKAEEKKQEPTTNLIGEAKNLAKEALQAIGAASSDYFGKAAAELKR